MERIKRNKERERERERESEKKGEVVGNSLRPLNVRSDIDEIT